MNPILRNLQNKQWVWTAANTKEQAPSNKLRTGFSSLDKVLSGGFPRVGMIHLHSLLGCGEMRLILSILRSQEDALAERKHKLFVFINPPFSLNAEFLLAENIALEQLILLRPKSPQDALWSAEQCAKSGACHSIFIWQKNLKYVQIRKLEHASIQGDCHCIWMDSTQVNQASHKSEKGEKSEVNARQNLPLSLSLTLSREDDELNIKVNKQKTGWAQNSIKIPLPFRTRNSKHLKNRGLHTSSLNKIVPIQSSR